MEKINRLRDKKDNEEIGFVFKEYDEAGKNIPSLGLKYYTIPLISDSLVVSTKEEHIQEVNASKCRAIKLHVFLYISTYNNRICYLQKNVNIFVNKQNALVWSLFSQNILNISGIESANSNSGIEMIVESL